MRQSHYHWVVCYALLAIIITVTVGDEHVLRHKRQACSCDQLRPGSMPGEQCICFPIGGQAMSCSCPQTQQQLQQSLQCDCNMHPQLQHQCGIGCQQSCQAQCTQYLPQLECASACAQACGASCNGQFGPLPYQSLSPYSVEYPYPSVGSNPYPIVQMQPSAQLCASCMQLCEQICGQQLFGNQCQCGQQCQSACSTQQPIPVVQQPIPFVQQPIPAVPPHPCIPDCFQQCEQQCTHQPRYVQCRPMCQNQCAHTCAGPIQVAQQQPTIPVLSNARAQQCTLQCIEMCTQSCGHGLESNQCQAQCQHTCQNICGSASSSPIPVVQQPVQGVQQPVPVLQQPVSVTPPGEKSQAQVIRISISSSLLQAADCQPQCEQTCASQCSQRLPSAQCQSPCEAMCQQSCAQWQSTACRSLPNVKCYCTSGYSPCSNGSHCCRKR